MVEDQQEHRDPEEPYGAFALIWSDYVRYCELLDLARGTTEAQRPNLVTAALRFVINAQLRAQILIRLSCASPRWLHWVFRSLLIYLHSSEVGFGAKIGPGLQVPHPWGVAIGEQARIGRNVAIAQNVTLGSDLMAEGQPIVEDGAFLLAGAMISGPVRIGRGAIVGANSVVVEDVPAGSVCAPAKLRVVRNRGAAWAFRRRGVDWPSD